ncbi:IS3 family transposase [Pasteurella atlantica]|uniref:IS3 family transposase n=1 Tax=Pasteurellaceae TaxID=712 RepID=UPI003B75CB1C
MLPINTFSEQYIFYYNNDRIRQKLRRLSLTQYGLNAIYHLKTQDRYISGLYQIIMKE